MYSHGWRTAAVEPARYRAAWSCQLCLRYGCLLDLLHEPAGLRRAGQSTHGVAGHVIGTCGGTLHVWQQEACMPTQRTPTHSLYADSRSNSSWRTCGTRAPHKGQQLSHATRRAAPELRLPHLNFFPGHVRMCVD